MDGVRKVKDEEGGRKGWKRMGMIIPDKHLLCSCILFHSVDSNTIIPYGHLFPNITFFPLWLFPLAWIVIFYECVHETLLRRAVRPYESNKVSGGWWRAGLAVLKGILRTHTSFLA